MADTELQLDNNELMEKIIFQTMFKDEHIRDALLPYIYTDLFKDTEAKVLYTELDNFMNANKTFPTLNDINLSLTDPAVKSYLNSCFNESILMSNYDKSFLLSEMEIYIKENLFENLVGNMLHDMSADGFSIDSASAYPDEMKDVLNFTFDDSVGFNLFSPEGMDRMADHYHSVSKYIPSGITGLDKMLGNGFHAKSLSLFLLPTNKGKSAIKGAIGANMAMAGNNVLYITLEMSEEMIGNRIMANIFDVVQDDLKTFQKTTLQKKFQKVASLIQDRFVVKEYPTGDMNSNKIRRLIKELKDKRDWVPDIIFVDYLGLMKTNSPRKSSAKHEDLKTVSEELRDIALEYDIPVVSSMQTNREGYDSADIDLSDMSESFGVAMTADVTIAGIMNEELKARGEYIWRIVKNRFGQNQQEINVGMDFAKMKLSDLGDMPRNIGEAGDFQNQPLHGMQTSAVDAIESADATDSNNNRQNASYGIMAKRGNRSPHLSIQH